MEGGEFHRAEADYAPNEIIEMETTAAMAPDELGSANALTDAPVQTDRKLIKTVTMDAETEHYDELIAALEEKLTALGGYTETRDLLIEDFISRITAATFKSMYFVTKLSVLPNM